MKDGNWISLDKRLVHYLPNKRAYTIMEAMFSFTKDLDENKENTIHGYARIWSWSRTKVRRFITDLKTSTRHEPDRDETGTRQEVRLINNDLATIKNPRKTGTRPPQDRDETITINPNPNPLNLCGFEEFWKVIHPRAKRCGKDAAKKAWDKHVSGNDEEVIKSATLHSSSQDWKKDNGQFVPMATTWINQHRWTAEVQGIIQTKWITDLDGARVEVPV